MSGKVNLWQLAGFAATALGGTLLHYLYDWTGGAVWVAPFSGVNESTWEHMKLLFWPMLLFAVAESFFFLEHADFWCVKARGTVLGLILIPVLFYTYNGAIGKSPDWINIAIFFVAAAIASLYEARQLHTGATDCRHPALAIGLLCVIAALFVLFTFLTPTLAIFRDPISGSFGISA